MGGGAGGQAAALATCWLFINQCIVNKQRCSWVWIAEMELGVDSRDGAGSASWD